MSFNEKKNKKSNQNNNKSTYGDQGKAKRRNKDNEYGTNKRSGRRREEKENRDITSTKRKAIEKVKPKKKHKIIEREEKLPEEDPVIYITTSINHALEISLPEIILNTIPNLVYLDLRDKSNSTIESTEQRFPDEIMNWLEFEQEVRRWQPETDKKYQKPIFRKRNVTCEKDIWSATDANIFDTLTPLLDRPVSFLDGRALKNIVGEPDFIIVDDHIKMLIPWESKTKWVLNVLPDQNIVMLYNEEKEFRERPYAYSNNASVYHSINQIYGYGVLSTYNQTWFFERGVTGEDYGWLHVSDAITNSSINPTLLKSVAYMIYLASNDHYAPFLEKPMMVADDPDKDDNDFDDSFSEKQGNREFKYKGSLLQNGPNVVTRNQSRKVLGSLDTNVN